MHRAHETFEHFLVCTLHNVYVHMKNDQQVAHNESTQCEHATKPDVCMHVPIACVWLNFELQEWEVLCTQHPIGSDFKCGPSNIRS